MTPLRQRMIDDMRVWNFSAKPSESTSVRSPTSQFFGQSPELLGPADVRTYQVYLSQQKSAS
jgi:integrase/recombinase XerD